MWWHAYEFALVGREDEGHRRGHPDRRRGTDPPRREARNTTSLLLANSQGLPLKVVAAGVASTGEDGKDFGAVIVKADSPIRTAKDLAGKRVAVNTLKNINTTTINKVVEDAGGDPSTISYVELPFPDIAAAVAKGDADAGQNAEVVSGFTAAMTPHHGVVPRAAPVRTGSLMNTAALEVTGLAKTYTGHGRSVEAVRDLTFRVDRGEMVCIVGPSGAGKTTLLRCIAGLLDTSGGRITLDGTPVTEPPPGMAVVFQEYGRSRPAACGSGSPSPARSRTSRPCCSWTSRSPPSTPRPAPTWRTWTRAVAPARRHRPVRHARHRRVGLPRAAGARAVQPAHRRARGRPGDLPTMMRPALRGLDG